jgi:hypothetical protein
MGEEEGKTTTIACRLDKVLVQADHVAIIRDAATRAHRATTLASRLLAFHALKCLERGLELPTFGSVVWAKKAWACVSESTRAANNRKDDPELVATRDEFMPELKHAENRVDSVRMGDVLAFEAKRWCTVFTNNAYLHFRKRVRAFVSRELRMDPDAYKALSKPEKVRHKTALARVALDICSPPTEPLRSAAEHHTFVQGVREEWLLNAFPWDGKPLEYHLKANNAKEAWKCHAHLLLPAMWRMRQAREANEQKGFALLPLRTRSVPRHTQFDAGALRALLGVGQSEYRKQQKREYEAERRAARKRQKLGEGSSAQHATAPPDVSPEDEAEGLGLDSLVANPAGDAPEEVEGPAPLSPSLRLHPASPQPVEEAEERPVAAPDRPAPKPKRKKADVAAEKREDLMRLFNLKEAGLHDRRGSVFNCTFTSDGVAAHLQFEREKAAAKESAAESRKKRQAPPRKGIFSAEELRGRIPVSHPILPGADDLLAPSAKVDRVCISCENGFFCNPFAGYVCVGCDPGRAEPVVCVDPLTGEKTRITAVDERRKTKAHGSFVRTARHRKQSQRRGLAEEHAAVEARAAVWKAANVDKPAAIGRLESELGQRCATAPSLADFAAYVSAVSEAAPTLVPHYADLRHRRLRFKTHIEKHRFVDRFIRDLKRKFAPNGEVVLLAWGAWGKVAGRAGQPGNKGRPPTLGVGLARRLAKEDGIVLMWTPEHHTTKTCFKCGCAANRSAKAEARRQADVEERLGERFRHGAKEIRGLKVCQNPECNAPLNRDLNAAKNIGANGMLLLLGCAPIATHTPEELALLDAENEMQGAP